MCNVSTANQQMDKMVVFQREEHYENDNDNDIGQERGEEFSFDIKQIRDKFKQCMSKCKKASLLMKTASGIKSFQEDRGFGKWFHCLLPLIQTKQSCPPELSRSSQNSTGSREEDFGISTLLLFIAKLGSKASSG